MHSAPANAKVRAADLRPDDLDPHNQLVEQRLAELTRQRREAMTRLESLRNEDPELFAISRRIEQLEHSLECIEEVRSTARQELGEPLQLQLIQRAARNQ